jgi:hypothetical protein
MFGTQESELKLKGQGHTVRFDQSSTGLKLAFDVD